MILKKRNGLLILFFAATSFTSMACDICGCGAGSYYIGILPEFNSKIIGLRYRSSQITTHLSPEGKRTYLSTDESYHNIEVWAGWTLKERFKIMANVPMSFNSKIKEKVSDSKAGLADITMQGYYRILRTKRSVGKAENAKLLVQDLWLGVGIKVPTGKYNPSDKNNNSSTNLFQLGTGSWDFILNGMYDLRLQDLGFNLTSSYKINTTNNYNYYYGNRFSSSFQVYHKFRFNNKFMLSPNVGVHYEQSIKDLDAGIKVRASGGTAIYGTLGLELQFNQISFGGNWQPILQQNLGSGTVQSGNRAMVHLSVML